MQPWFGKQREAMRALFEQPGEHAAHGHEHGRVHGQHHEGPSFGFRGGPRGGGPGGRPWRGFGPFGGPFGGPPGGKRHGWGPFGPGAKVRKGDVRAAALALIAEQPRNGYQIIQEIAERSNHLWRPSSGSVYPALQLLEDEGLIRAEVQEGRRTFVLTDAGREYVEAHKDELAAPWDVVTAGVNDEALGLWQLIPQVGMAVVQVTQVGTPAQVEQARQILVNARRSLYQLLAQDDAESPDETL